MRRMHRLVLLVALVALAPGLVGCENFDTEKFDIFGINDKKKLKGERKELFPEGVPGVTQGLPPEYLRNKQLQPDSAQTPPALPANTAAGAPTDKAAAPAPPGKTAAVEPAAEPKPEPKPKRKPKPRTAARPATQGTAQPAAQRQNGGQQQRSPWPDQNQAQAPAPAPAQGQSMSTAPWPSAPPPGTFSR
jgi:hypothetical protein